MRPGSMSLERPALWQDVQHPPPSRSGESAAPLRRFYPDAPSWRRPCAKARGRRDHLLAVVQAQISQAAPASIIDQHELSAPCAAIVAVSISIERDAQHRERQFMLRRNRRDMRRMMLRAKYRQSTRLGPARGEEIRMEIAGDLLRLYVENLQKSRDRLLEGIDGCSIGQAADMRREKRFPASRDRNRRLQMRSQRKRVRAVSCKLDRGLERNLVRAARTRGARIIVMTLSSARATISRPCPTTRSATPRSLSLASSSSAIRGSPARLALVATRTHSCDSSRHTCPVGFPIRE